MNGRRLAECAAFTLAVGLLIVVTDGAVAAQRDGQVGARDARAVATGTGVIAGVVVSAGDPSSPVRRASVLLASGQVAVPRTAVTDDQGRFAFVGLPDGNYTLAARKAAWVSAVYGARSASDSQGIPIAVANGQRIDGLRLPIARGAVVAGTVRLASGQPAQDVAVQVLKIRTVDGRRQLSTTAAPAQTDDLGRYRVFGLATGEYVVQARSQASLVRSRVTRQVTASEVRWGEELLAQAQSVSGVPADALQVPPPGSAVTYSTVYFPGTTFASDSSVVSLRAGEERLNVDFSLSLVPTAQISGTVVGPDGAPFLGAAIMLTPEDGGVSDVLSLMIRGGRSASGRDGTFSITGVTPGRYTVTARGTPRAPDAMIRLTPAAPANAEMVAALSMLGGMLGGANTATLWASEPIAVNGDDLPSLTLVLRDGLTFEGRVVLERGLDGGPEGGNDVPPNVTTLRITLAEPQSGDPIMAMMGRTLGMGTMAATPGEDGAFVVKGLVPGQYAISVGGRPMRVGLPGMPDAASGFVVKSIRWNDQDLADTGVTVQASGAVVDVVVTLTPEPSELGGMVLDASGRPTGAFPIVVFSDNRAFWTPGSRRVKQVQPASDGRFLVVGLPGGDYYLAAVTRLEPGDLENRQFLEDLIPAGLRITVGDGEKKTQDVKLAGGR